MRRRRQPKAVDDASTTTTASVVDSLQEDIIPPPPKSGLTNRNQPRVPKPKLTNDSFDSSTTTAVDSRHDHIIPTSSTSGLTNQKLQRVPKRDVSDGVTNKVKSLGAGGALWTGFHKTPASSRNTTPAPQSDATVHRPSTDPLPGLNPERPRPSGSAGSFVFIPPSLHPEPRAWAPASHSVPAVVKRTWGRTKAKLSAKQADQPIEQ